MSRVRTVRIGRLEVSWYGLPLLWERRVVCRAGRERFRSWLVGPAVVRWYEREAG